MDEESSQKTSFGNTAADGGADARPPRAAAADLTGIFRPINVQGGVKVQGSGAQRSESTGVAAEDAENLGFTQMFQSLEPSPQPAARREEKAAEPAGGSGEFTQLFQPLTPMQAPAMAAREKKEPARFSTASLQPASAPVPGGSFTQLLRTLSDEEAQQPRGDFVTAPFGGSPAAASPVASSPAVRPIPQQPGEFTRIISRSALREATLREQQQRGGEDALPEPAAASPLVPPPQGTPAAPPLAHMPMLSVPMPEMQSPMPEYMPPAASPVPVAPPLPSLPGGRLQEYLPVLLIANLLLTAVTLAVVIAMLVRAH